MATTTARNQNDVNNMSVRDRLWDSLNYSYGKKREESDKSFAKAYSQAVNQGLKTGMQRSSYGAQTLANINKQQIDAQNDIYDQQIADYENRIYQIERDEKADEQWEKEYQEKLREFDEQMAYQKERSNVSDAQWEKEYAEKKRQFDEQMEYQKDEFKYKWGLAGGGSGGSSGGGGYGGNGGYNPTPNNDDNGGKGLNWFDEVKLTTKNATTDYTKKATSAATALSKAFEAYDTVMQPIRTAQKAEAQAAQDKKNAVTYQVNNKKQSTSKNVISTKK